MKQLIITVILKTIYYILNFFQFYYQTFIFKTINIMNMIFFLIHEN